MFINLCRLTEYTGGRKKLDSYTDIHEAIKAAEAYVETAQDLGEDVELVIDFHYERKEKKDNGSK